MRFMSFYSNFVKSLQYRCRLVCCVISHKGAIFCDDVITLFLVAELLRCVTVTTCDIFSLQFRVVCGSIFQPTK